MKGSRYEMLKFIESSNFLDELNKLLKSANARVTAYNNWMPKSIHLDKEAELKDFLKYNYSEEWYSKLVQWWLHVDSTTPNWDLVSTCTVNGQNGIVLIEAKAHVAELENESKKKPFDENKASDNSRKNHDKIAHAINRAKTDIKNKEFNIDISRDKCYQLSNRVAHAWWLANHGIPVVLLYLGFLNCNEMNDGKNIIFKKDEDWQQCFRNHTQQVGVDTIINQWVDCGKSKFITICKSYKCTNQ